MIIDLWCAPLITSIYALLTHAQPFWADLHGSVVQLLGQNASAGGLKAAGPAPVDPEYARALCAMILVVLFTGRTAKNFKDPVRTDAVAKKKEKKG
jgi:hypothetical protein